MKELDHPDVLAFMALYQKLREFTDDDPDCLLEMANSDTSVSNMCDQLCAVWARLGRAERGPQQFIAPVNPAFIPKWRDYEKRFERIVQCIAISNLFRSPGEEISPPRPAVPDELWRHAEYSARLSANAIETAIEFAEEEAECWFGNTSTEAYQEHLEDAQSGVERWEFLRKEIGLDVEGIFRRHELVPFVLIPRHVSNQYGQEKLSLFTLLHEAQRAFVFGLPFATIALMRSTLELVLKNHYGAIGTDIKALIASTASLPRGIIKQHLRDLLHLANGIVHANDQVPLPTNVEKAVFDHLQRLRILIEDAPPKSRSV